MPFYTKRLDHGMTYLGRLAFLHGLLGVLWQRVFSKELRTNWSGVLEQQPGEGSEAMLDRLVQQLAQNAEQGIRVQTTQEWLAGTIQSDLALARIFHAILQSFMVAQIKEASYDWELDQRARLDEVGSREFRLVNAARGTLHTRCLVSLGQAVQGRGPWHLYTTWVGESSMSAFAAFRVASRGAGAVHLRFETRTESWPLKAVQLLRESVPDKETEDSLFERCRNTNRGGT